jgi:hypothetical protein
MFRPAANVTATLPYRAVPISGDQEVPAVATKKAAKTSPSTENGGNSRHLTGEETAVSSGLRVPYTEATPSVASVDPRAQTGIASLSNGGLWEGLASNRWSWLPAISLEWGDRMLRS